jgi:cytochrome c-type biogenesis protein CcmE
MSGAWRQILAIAAATAIVVAVALSVSTPPPRLTLLEAVHARAEFSGGNEMELPGVIVGTVHTAHGTTLFDMGEGAVVITVRYDYEPPDGLREGVGVVVRGTWTEDVVTASSVKLTEP